MNSTATGDGKVTRYNCAAVSRVPTTPNLRCLLSWQRHSLCPRTSRTLLIQRVLAEQTYIAYCAHVFTTGGLTSVGAPGNVLRRKKEKVREEQELKQTLHFKLLSILKIMMVVVVITWSLKSPSNVIIQVGENPDKDPDKGPDKALSSFWWNL